MLDTRRNLYRFYAYAPFALFMLLRLPCFFWVIPNWSDIGLYKFFAESFLAGQTPYFDFKVEYPPLTLVLFVIPGFLAKLFGGFETIYRLQMALFDFGCLVLIGPLSHHIFKADKRGVFISRIVYLVLGVLLFQIIYDRFDIAVAFLIMFSLYLALVREKWTFAYIVLWLATLIKLFPVILLPLFIITQARMSKNGKRAASNLGYSLGFLFIALIVLQIIFGNWWETVLGYHGKRGIQIESLYAAIALVAREFGTPAALNHEFGAYQISNSFTAFMANISPIIIVFSIILLYYGFHRLASGPLDIARRRQSLVKAVLAALLVFIVFNKVLSPQYLLWLIPLAAVTMHTRKDYYSTLPLWILTVGATAFLFPYNYVSLLTLKPLGVWMVIFRDTLLFVLTALITANLFRKRVG